MSQKNLIIAAIVGLGAALLFRQSQVDSSSNSFFGLLSNNRPIGEPGPVSQNSAKIKTYATARVNPVAGATVSPVATARDISNKSWII